MDLAKASQNVVAARPSPARPQTAQPVSLQPASWELARLAKSPTVAGQATAPVSSPAVLTKTTAPAGEQFTLQKTGSQNVVQRMREEHREEEHREMEYNQPQPGPSIEELAEKILPLVKSILAIELERSGNLFR
jgi:hypothetical protein